MWRYPNCLDSIKKGKIMSDKEIPDSEETPEYVTRSDFLKFQECITSSMQKRKSYEEIDAMRLNAEQKYNCIFKVSFLIALLIAGFIIYKYNIETLRAYTEAGFRIKREVISHRDEYSDYWSKD